MFGYSTDQTSQYFLLGKVEVGVQKLAAAKMVK
jgi:hypothetical protein